jgi:thioesterase domain-containing protein
LPKHDPEADYELLIPIQRGDRSRRPLFILPGGWGGELEFLVYATLARLIDPQLPLYGLRARRHANGGVGDATVEEIAAAALAEMRRFQPHGPYLLAGECVGGIVAYEMARQLRAAGETLDLLLLLDTARPSAALRHWFATSERLEHWRLVWEWKVRQPWQRHCEALAKLSLGEKCRYIWHRLSRERTWPATQPPQHPRADDRTILADYPKKLMAHTPKPYEGTVTLLVDEVVARGDRTLGWTGTHPGPLEIHVVPGDHKTYIREHAATAAAKLRDLLARAERSALPSA